MANRVVTRTYAASIRDQSRVQDDRDDSDSEQATRLNQKKSARRTHYFHTLSKHIVQRCMAEGVGTIVAGDLSGIREDEESGESRNWGKRGNLDHIAPVNPRE